MRKILVFPSILSADFSNFEAGARLAKESLADGIHLDVMDGHFVPNITFGMDLVKSLRKKTDLFLDSHLMIDNPTKYAEKFADAGSDNVTFHIEACRNEEEARGIIKLINKSGSKASISIKPKTSPEKIKNLIIDSDLFAVLVMTVEPGFGGQEFMGEMMPKVRKINNWIKDSNLKTNIQVDGGINAQTAKIAIDAGANIMVAGSALYKHKTVQGMADAIRSLKNSKC